MTVLIAMNFILSMSASVFGGIQDQIADQMHISIAETGCLNSMYACGASIGVPVFLIFFHQADRTKLLKIMLGLNIAATALLLMTDSYPLLLLIRFLMGVAGNCYSVMATAIVSAFSAKDRIGSELSHLILGSALALVAGIPLTRALSGLLDWRGIFMILNAGMIVSLLYFLFHLPSLPQKETPGGIVTQFAFLKDRKVRLALITSMITFIGYGALYMYMTPYLLAVMPSLSGSMAWVLAGIGLSAFMGNLLGGVLADRFGCRKALLGGSLLQAVLAALLFCFHSIGWLTLILCFVWMMNGWMIGLQINTAMIIATQNRSSFMVSLNNSGIQLGQAVGAGISSVLMTGLSMRFILLPSLVCSLITALMERKREGK